MSGEFSAAGLAYKLRTQFSFIVDDPTLSCILNGIASQNISITGYLQTKPLYTDGCRKNSSNMNLVRLAVGSPDKETAGDLSGVRNVLDALDVDYQKKPVIQVLFVIAGTPGIINGIFGALWCKVAVNAFYFGEESRLFIDVSDVCTAFRILTEVPTAECPKQCAPNC